MLLERDGTQSNEAVLVIGVRLESRAVLESLSSRVAREWPGARFSNGFDFGIWPDDWWVASWAQSPPRPEGLEKWCQALACVLQEYSLSLLGWGMK